MVSTAKLENYLRSFFQLFNADVLRYQVERKMIIGTIGWIEEEETQDFSWHTDLVGQPPPDIEVLCNFLVVNRLINIDAFTVSEEQLLERLVSDGWQREAALACISYLLSTEVKMVDDGKETDSFFLHF